jgi:hypothetical protein
MAWQPRRLMEGPRPRWVLPAAGAAAGILLLVLLLVLRTATDDTDAPMFVEAPFPVVAEGEPEVPELAPAYLAAPVVYDLAMVLQRLEEQVPVVFGDLDERAEHSDNDRVELSYRVQRSPFQAEIHGDTARISAVLTYQGRVWYDPPLLPAVSASCGLEEDEEPPRARVSLSSRLHLDEDWVLRSRAQVDSVYAMSDEDRDRCRVTILDIDVTGTALSAVRSALQGRTDRIDEEVAGIDLRSRLQGVWEILEEPVELTDDLWLVVNPVGVRRGRTIGEGQVLTVEVGMTARPRLVLGPRPDVAFTEIPRLEDGPVPDQSTILLEGRVHYPEAGDLLMRQLRDREVVLGNRLLRIRDLGLEGIGGGRIALRLDFEGTAQGRIFLVGRPELDPASGQIHVPDLDFDLRTRNLLVGSLAWLAQDQVVAFLRQRARIPIETVLEAAREQLMRGLNRDLSDEVSVEGDVLDLHLREVIALREILVIHAEAEAYGILRVRQEVNGARPEVDGEGEGPLEGAEDR